MWQFIWDIACISRFKWERQLRCSLYVRIIGRARDIWARTYKPPSSRVTYWILQFVKLRRTQTHPHQHRCEEPKLHSSILWHSTHTRPQWRDSDPHCFWSRDGQFFQNRPVFVEAQSGNASLFQVLWWMAGVWFIRCPQKFRPVCEIARRTRYGGHAYPLLLWHG